MAYDVAVVGAGIVGLAHALAAAKCGKKVVVLDRDATANGASIRNFGFVTVTGQQAGDCWQLARRSRDVWADVVDKARIDVLHEGLLVAARYEESDAVIDAFLDTEMGHGCQRLTPRDASQRSPALKVNQLRSVLYSPHEMRVESRDALPRLAEWLEFVWKVDFLWSTAVHSVETPKLETTRGEIYADVVLVCPGNDYLTLFADRIARYKPTACKLQMLRVSPETSVRLGAAVMSDFGLARYLGYSELPEAEPLIRRLEAEQTDMRSNGIHLIAVQSADGSLVVGDSHEYGETLTPFVSSRVNDLILSELDAVLDLGARQICETWIGTYASAKDRWRFTDQPDDATRIVVVTAGCGASTAFGIAEETVGALYGRTFQ